VRCHGVEEYIDGVGIVARDLTTTILAERARVVLLPTMGFHDSMRTLNASHSLQTHYIRVGYVNKKQCIAISEHFYIRENTLIVTVHSQRPSCPVNAY
jgi:hypothetical protein